MIICQLLDFGKVFHVEKFPQGRLIPKDKKKFDRKVWLSYEHSRLEKDHVGMHLPFSIFFVMHKNRFIKRARTDIEQLFGSKF